MYTMASRKLIETLLTIRCCNPETSRGPSGHGLNQSFMQHISTYSLLSCLSEFLLKMASKVPYFMRLGLKKLIWNV